MSALELAVNLVAPDLTRYDITDRVDLGGISSLNEELEDDTLSLVHGDMELAVKDADGFIEGLLGQALPTDIWQMELDRKAPVRRAKWERLFSGILDVPFSVQVDRTEGVLSVQAFSLSKLLEKFSAELTKRDVSGVTCTVSSGTILVTCTPDATDFARGDVVVLDNGVNQEQKTIISVQLSTFSVETNYSNSFTDAMVNLLTPFLRHQTLEDLATTLFNLAGITDVNIALGQVSALSVPFRQGWTSAGLSDLNFEHLISRPLNSENGEPAIQLQAGAFVESLSPGSKWTTHGGGFPVKADWTAYLDTEPASLESVPVGSFELDRDVQRNTGMNNLSSADWNAGYDHELGDRWGIRQVGALPNPIALYKDGSFNVNLDNTGNGNPRQAAVEFIPAKNWGLAEDIIAVSWLINETSGGTATSKLQTRRLSNTSTVGPSDTFGPGGMRCINGIQRLAVQRWSNKKAGNSGGGGKVDFFSASDTAPHLVLDSTTEENTRTILMWTMRELNKNFIAAMYHGPGEQPLDPEVTRVKVWRWPSLEVVADVQVSAQIDARTYMTKHTVKSSRGVEHEVLVGFVDKDVFLLAPVYVGTIPYANVSGKSCAGALAELALIGLSYLNVDHYRTGTLFNRESVDGFPDELPPAESHVSNPWSRKHFKTSVLVKGDGDIEVLAGDPGASADRLDITSRLIDTEGMAAAIGEAYSSNLGLRRRLDEVTVPEDGEPLAHVLDLKGFEGVNFRVIGVETDLDDRSQSLKLLETPDA